MNTYTIQDWHNDRDFKASVGQKVEAEIYWNMLCGMPPVYSNRDTFQVGEAHSHDSKGHPLYGTFTRQGDDYYFLGYLRCNTEAIAEAKRKYLS